MERLRDFLPLVKCYYTLSLSWELTKVGGAEGLFKMWWRCEEVALPFPLRSYLRLLKYNSCFDYKTGKKQPS